MGEGKSSSDSSTAISREGNDENQPRVQSTPQLSNGIESVDNIACDDFEEEKTIPMIVELKLGCCRKFAFLGRCWEFIFQSNENGSCGAHIGMLGLTTTNCTITILVAIRVMHLDTEFFCQDLMIFDGDRPSIQGWGNFLSDENFNHFAFGINPKFKIEVSLRGATTINLTTFSTLHQRSGFDCDCDEKDHDWWWLGNGHV